MHTSLHCGYVGLQLEKPLHDSCQCLHTCWLCLLKVTSLGRQWWTSWEIKIVVSTWRACSWLQEVWCLLFQRTPNCQECTILQQLQILRGEEQHLTSAGCILVNPFIAGYDDLQLFFGTTGLCSSRSFSWSTATSWRRRPRLVTALMTQWRRNPASRPSPTANMSCSSSMKWCLPSLTLTR